MLEDIQYASHTKNCNCAWEQKENGQNKCPIFPTKNMENHRKEKNKTELFVILPHLISSRKQTPQGLGNRILKRSPGPESGCSTRKCVFINSSHLPSLIPPWTAFSLPETFIYKNDCESTVLMVSWAPRAKMWDIYANREMFLINITPEHCLSPGADKNLPRSSISGRFLRASHCARPPAPFSAGFQH